MPELHFGTRAIGAGHPTYFIAEAGSNHDRDLEQAKRLVEVAAEAGADAVKFQTFKADRLYPRSAGMTDYLGDPRSIHEIIRSLEMPLEWIPVLAKHARDRGLDFISTPFDLEAIESLLPHVPALKIASYEMTYHGLVQAAARTGKPLIISTGTAKLDEVRAMVAAARSAGCKELVILQCTAKYPAPLSALNLRAMVTMARELGVEVGLSDHSREPLPGPMAAVALGAAVIEKHFTLSNRLPGPDHAYALEPHELIEVVKQVRAVERSLGTGVKEPAPEELELRAFARRSLFTTTALPQGATLTHANLAVLRCGKLPYGLHPADYLFTLGRTTRRALGEEATVREDDLAALELVDGDVTLRAMSLADAEHVVRWRNQPEVHGQLFAETPPTRAQHDAWFDGLRMRGDRVEFTILVGGAPVGTINLGSIDPRARTASYGILLGDSAHRGKHVASRASRLILDYGFRVLGLSRIDLSHFLDNAPARALYDRLGFVETARGEVTKSGRTRGVAHMQLTPPVTSGARSPG